MAKKITFNLKLKNHDVLMIISFVLCALTFCLVFLMMDKLQPVVPLFYTLPDGNEQLLDKHYLYLLPSLSLAVNLITVLFLSLSRTYHEVLLKLFTVCVLVFQIMFLLVTARIILLVI